MRKLLVINAVAFALLGMSQDGYAQGLSIKEMLQKKSKVELNQSQEAVFTPDNAMQNYERFIASRAEYDEMKREALLRLANLYLEKESASDDEHNQMLGSAIDLYLEILDNYPQHENNAEVMYQLASAYEQRGQFTESVTTFYDLNEQFPDYHSDEVAFRQGEILFNLERFSEAEKHYAQAVSHGSAGVYYEKAINKQGWALFKEEKYVDAIKVFFSLINIKLKDIPDGKLEQGIASFDVGEREVLRDALRAVSLAFTYQDDINEIVDYVQQYSEARYEYLVFDEVAQFYLSKERNQDAVSIYKKFIDLHPYHKQAPYFQLKVIGIYQENDRVSMALTEKAFFADRYNADAGYWRHYQGKMGAILTGELQSMLKELARYMHAQGQAQNDRQAFHDAEKWYRLFLKGFAKDPAAVEMSFLLAEMLFELKQYEPAIQEYERTAYSYSRSDRGAEAGYAALLAYDAILNGLKPSAESAMLTWKNAAIKSTLRFAKVYPRHKQTPRSLTRAAEILFSLGELVRAKHLAEKIVQWNPMPEATLRYSAWNILGHAAFAEENYVTAERAYGQAVTLADEKNANSVNSVRERQAASIYQQGDQLQRKGKLYEANLHFERLAQVITGTEINAVAIYDAAANWITLKEWDKALKALNVFRFAFPEHRFTKDVEEKTIFALLEKGEYQRAIGMLERAVEFTENVAERPAIYLRIAHINEEAGEMDAAMESYRRYLAIASLTVEEEILTRYKLAEHYKKHKKESELEMQWSAIIELGNNNELEKASKARHIYVEAKFLACEPLFKEFMLLELSDPVQASLKRKKQKMQAALNAYNQVIKFGLAKWVTASTYRIAEIYNEFSQALLSSKRPAGLTDLELEQYEVLLEEQAFPFEEKSIQAHQLNTSRAKDGVYDEWVKKSFDRLKALYPGRYGKKEKREGFIFAIK